MKLATYKDGSRDGQLVVVSRDLGTAHYATGIAERLQQALLRGVVFISVLAAPFVLGEDEAFVRTSIGIAMFPEDGRSVEDLLRSAEVAMYRVKNETRNGFRFYAPGMQERTARALQLTNALKLALARDELRLVYQPQVSLVTGELVGAEALLRWQHPQRGLIPLGEFLPVLQNSSLMLEVGLQIFEQMLATYRLTEAECIACLTQLDRLGVIRVGRRFRFDPSDSS